MELYILDDLFRKTKVYDTFESFIWTERFNEVGDFEVLFAFTPTIKSEFVVGVHLGMDKSDRIMTIKTVEEKAGSDGKRMLKIKGDSLEGILKDRVVRPAMSGTKDESGADASKWKLQGLPGELIRKLFHDICIEGKLDPLDKLSGVEEIYVPNRPTDIKEPIDTTTVEIDITSLYDSIRQIADVWGYGFKLTKHPYSGSILWEVYTGRDRTTSQQINNPVLFAPELDNLTNITELNSIVTSKNVAYVFGADEFVIVYPDNVPPDIDSFERRVLFVKADNITAANTDDVVMALTQLGRNELVKNRAVQAFDGEIRQHSQYVYGRDYALGDIVEIRNTDGMSNRMRVTEQIFVSDRGGERTYPTLELFQFVNTGSWLSWDANKTWLDLDADPVTWSELP